MSGLLDVINSPWAIIPGKLSEISGIYLTHLRSEKIDIASIEAKIGPMNNEAKHYQVIDGVAVVPIYGVIAKRANMFTRVSGGVSIELLSADLKAIEENDSIKAVILDIDSPGGNTDGVDALAEQVHAMQKPIVSYANGTMASAGYWIGSAANAVYSMDDTTVVGSIGVVTQKIDPPKNGSDGEVHEIYAGKYKRIVSSHRPLDDEGHEYLQKKVDYFYSVFVGKVAKFRGVSVQTVLKGMADGETYIGKQAIGAGLVDGIATLDSLIADLSGGATKARPATKQTNHSTGVKMSIKETAKINWETDVGLKTEFNNSFESYLAYMKANANGQVRILSGSVINTENPQGEDCV